MGAHVTATLPQAWSGLRCQQIALGTLSRAAFLDNASAHQSGREKKRESPGNSGREG